MVKSIRANMTVEVIEYLNKFPEEIQQDKFDELIQIGIAVMYRVSVNRDMEFVQKETHSMLLKLRSELEKLFNGMTTDIGAVITKNQEKHVAFTENVSDNLSASIDRKIMDFNRDLQNVATTVKIMLDNSKSVSTDELGKINSTLDVLKTKLNPNDSTSYLGAIKETVVNLQQKLFDLVDEKRNDSFTRKLMNDVSQYFGSSSPVISSVNDIVKTFTNNVNDSLISLREEIARKEGADEMLSKTAIKGFDFEGAINDSLSEYAKEFGDIVTVVGLDKKSSLKGDFIYEYADGNRIVVEAKDTTVGMKPMLDYMKEALENRECNFGILVTKYDEQLPKQVGSFNIYGNVLFCSHRDLKLAIRWMRIFIQKVSSASAEKDSINISHIEQQIVTVQNQIKNFINIKKKLNGVTSFVEKENNSLWDLCVSMKKDIENSIEEISSSISK